MCDSNDDDEKEKFKTAEWVLWDSFNYGTGKAEAPGNLCEVHPGQPGPHRQLHAAGATQGAPGSEENKTKIVFKRTDVVAH